MAGSGIKSIAHLTLETVAHIEQADKVFYCVADPGTEAFIKSKAKEAIDLYILYDNDKNRYNTYVQMAEMMLRAARDGFFVVGVFYGHPGVFVSPSHRAIGIAQREGIETYMLPGISAEDCLFSDLGIDPSFTGCQTVEATDLLLRDRPLNIQGHVILWQVGVVGDTGFNFQGFKKTKFQVLVDRLEKDYGADHEIIHYFASTLSHSKPHIEPLAISELRNPNVEKRITGISTFYVPAKGRLLPKDEMAKKLGLRVDAKAPDRSFGGLKCPDISYNEGELRAVKALDTHTIPENYRKNRLSPALLPVLTQLATSPNAVTKFKRNPERFLATFDNITPNEKRVLKTSSPGMLRALSLRSSADVASQFVQAEFRDPTLAQKYASVLAQNNGDPDGETNIIAFLKQQGYDTTPEDVNTAYLQAISVNIDTYDGYYASTFTNGGDGPNILIQNGGVTVNGTAIKKPIYSQSLLQWSTSDGNAFNALLTFRVLTADDSGRPLPAGSYIGPQFYGSYWGNTKPTSPNIQGKTGTAPPQPVNPVNPVQPTPLDTFSGNFVTYICDANGKWSEDSTFVISDATGTTTATASYKGKTLNNFTYSGNESLSWSTTDGNDTNGSIGFFINKTSTSTNPTLGPQASGRVWPASGVMPEKPNFFMNTGQSANPATQSQPSAAAQLWKSIGINLGVGIATMIVGTALIELFKAVFLAKQNPGNAEIQAQLKEAIDKLNQKLDAQKQMSDQGVQTDEAGGAGEEVNPSDIPVPDAPVTTTDTTTTDVSMPIPISIDLQTKTILDN